MSEPCVGAVLLAAGQGSRFGQEPKLLAKLDGIPLARRAALAALGSRARPIIVVLGAHAELVRPALDGLDVAIIENPDHAHGLSSSLRAGIAALPEEAQAVLVLLADMPRIEACHCDALIAAYSSDRGAVAIVPTFEGRRGNPVLLAHRALAADLAGIEGDRGAARLLAGRQDVRELSLDEAILRDVDTPDALAAL